MHLLRPAVLADRTRCRRCRPITHERWLGVDPEGADGISADGLVLDLMAQEAPIRTQGKDRVHQRGGCDRGARSGRGHRGCVGMAREVVLEVNVVSAREADRRQIGRGMPGGSAIEVQVLVPDVVVAFAERAISGAVRDVPREHGVQLQAQLGRRHLALQHVANGLVRPAPVHSIRKHGILDDDLNMTCPICVAL